MGEGIRGVCCSWDQTGRVNPLIGRRATRNIQLVCVETSCIPDDSTSGSQDAGNGAKCGVDDCNHFIQACISSVIDLITPLKTGRTSSRAVRPAQMAGVKMVGAGLGRVTGLG